VTYRVELGSRAIRQLHGLPAAAFDGLVDVLADVAGYPDEPLRTFPTGDPYMRRAEFGGAGLVTYLVNDAAWVIVVLDVTWAG
jgi:hypothetical protein